MTTHGSVAKSMRETIERLRAEVAQAEGVARGYMLAAEKAEAEVAEYRAEGMVPAGAWAHDLEQLKKLEAERDALRADLSRTLAEVERPFRERIERAEAALREIEQATEGIPEQNCALANHIARVALAGRLKP
jgi:DNA repair exonuclease SbcCD ATPase subunit